jgi:threonine synthase
MKFKSTRNSHKLYTFEEALLSGYAPDGGLFVPESLPQIDVNTLEEWAKLDFLELALEILFPFLEEDIPRTDLQGLLHKALGGFDTDVKNLVPVVPLTCNVFVAELFHGPTFCFKDLGLRATVQWLNYFAIKRDIQVTLIVATTGDTGPAAVQAVQDCASPHLGILVHYPEGQISDFQRKQLTTCASNRVKIVAFQGGGDDMDVPIKNIMTRSDNNDDEHVVCGVNSYNIGRPLMQMVHFFWTYLRVVDKLRATNTLPNDFQLDIIIPTGAMGNMAGCYMAKQMGVPIGKLCAGVNINDVTNVAFTTGKIQKPAETEPMKKTLSDAINIQLPYNLERLLFYLTNENHDQVREWYAQLEGRDRGFDMQSTVAWWTKLQSEFLSERITDDEMCDTMQSVLEEYSYWADPHTCVALAAAHRLGYLNDSKGSNSSPVVAVMATAAVCKFQEAVTAALGKDRWDEYEQDHFPPRSKDLKDLEETSPMLYTADPSKSLAENQATWEARTRKSFEDLER